MQGVQPKPKQIPATKGKIILFWLFWFWNLASKFKKDKFITPKSWREKIMIIVEAIMTIILEFENKNWLIADAVAPNKINTTEKPRVKKMVLNKTLLWKFLLISCKDCPEISEMYPGISGRTQGDKKLTSPAKKATNSDTLIIYK